MSLQGEDRACPIKAGQSLSSFLFLSFFFDNSSFTYTLLSLLKTLIRVSCQVMPLNQSYLRSPVLVRPSRSLQRNWVQCDLFHCTLLHLHLSRLHSTHPSTLDPWIERISGELEGATSRLGLLTQVQANLNTVSDLRGREVRMVDALTIPSSPC